MTLAFQNREDVTAYVVSAANTLDAAFTAPTALFTVPRDGFYRSASLRKLIPVFPTTTRGLTIAILNFEDFWQPSTTLPHDADVAFLSVQEVNAAGHTRPAGPVLIVPPPSFFATSRPNLTVAGTAPNVAASSTGLPPPGVLHFVLPRHARTASFRNSGSFALNVAFGPGQVEYVVPATSTVLLPDATFSELFVRGTGGAPAFTAYFAVSNTSA